MRYNGYSKIEVDRVSVVLAKYQLVFTVGIPEDLGDGKKIPRDSAVFFIDLEDSELNKVSEADRLKLADLRIHGEVESPFTEEELQNLENYVPKVSPKTQEQSKMNQWATILAVGSILALFLYKKFGP